MADELPDEMTDELPDEMADRMPDVSAPATCPACAGRLFPRELQCADCGLRVETRYQRNEFTDLDDESLHLLRIFVASEGRIRDMEASLGVSYPTVKSRLAALRERLGVDAQATPDADKRPPDSERLQPEPAPAATPKDVLDALENGEIEFDEAVRRIRNLDK